MTVSKIFSIAALSALSLPVMAADFSFDRPGAGMSTGITPVGRLAWEQSLPNANYAESRNENGEKVKTTTLNADMLFRTGLAQDLELQLGWQGLTWSKSKVAGKSVEDDGLGDVSIGLKKAIDLNDDRLSMAILAEAVLATGNEGFSNEDDIYSLSSAVAYKYNDTVNTSINMRYEIQNSDWAVTAIPGMDYQIMGNLSGFSELVYRKAESTDEEISLASGLIYAVSDRMQFDASVGLELLGDHKNYQSALGVAYLF